MRIGFGYDVHAFGPGSHVVLGGVSVPHDRGVVAHSDGDVMLHALCDALLGAMGLGDIGQHFPDSGCTLEGRREPILRQTCAELMRERGWRLVNADLTLLAEAPRPGRVPRADRTNIAEDARCEARPHQHQGHDVRGARRIGRGEASHATPSCCWPASTGSN
jgi:2-C-methyl-D-erythritol 2,4-cyclodiphosphate synthase